MKTKAKFDVGDRIVELEHINWVYTVIAVTANSYIIKRKDRITLGRKFIESVFILESIANSPLNKALSEEN
jgi:hypothetical protein